MIETAARDTTLPRHCANHVARRVTVKGRPWSRTIQHDAPCVQHYIECGCGHRTSKNPSRIVAQWQWLAACRQEVAA